MPADPTMQNVWLGMIDLPCNAGAAPLFPPQEEPRFALNGEKTATAYNGPHSLSFASESRGVGVRRVPALIGLTSLLSSARRYAQSGGIGPIRRPAFGHTRADAGIIRGPAAALGFANLEHLAVVNGEAVGPVVPRPRFPQCGADEPLPWIADLPRARTSSLGCAERRGGTNRVPILVLHTHAPPGGPAAGPCSLA